MSAVANVWQLRTAGAIEILECEREDAIHQFRAACVAHPHADVTLVHAYNRDVVRVRFRAGAHVRAVHRAGKDGRAVCGCLPFEYFRPLKVTRVLRRVTCESCRRICNIRG